MVEIRKTTRRGAQKQSSSTMKEAPKTRGASSTRLAKRKVNQEELQKSASPAKSGVKKRVKKEIPSYLHNYKAGQGPNHENPLLRYLPKEIFIEVTSWLEPDALTCLSLTCKEMLDIVGIEVWIECRPKRFYWDQANRSWGLFSRKSLISLLGRDSPHLLVCEWCMSLHPPLKPPREHRNTTVTRHCFGPGNTIDYLPKDEHVGYSLVWEHIVEARNSLIPESADRIHPTIKLLGGDFTIRHEGLDYTLKSTGRQIGKFLVLKHEHLIQGTSPRSPLRIADITALCLRICPHQTTSIEKPEEGRYTKSRLPSGLLTHSIATTAPILLKAGLPPASKFCSPAPSEKRQMDSTVNNGETIWTCRACPTKWRVQYDGRGAGKFTITAWHSFGDTGYRAKEYWKMLVRREAANLAAEKRNSEFFIVARRFLDFKIDEG